jgi:phosphoribosylanthranilate isomerase
VFVNAALSELEAAQAICRFDLSQLHGDETPAFCRQLGLPIIKAFRIRNTASLKPMAGYYPYVRFVLCDAYRNKQFGGTGQNIPESLLSDFSPPCPWILAGGIRPANARKSWHKNQPFAMDVCSGVELRPGIKSAAKIARLVDACLPR